ncbi:MAG: hypothetical protein P1P84_01100 [Deferrisomatales bacterium]|nr:hypothetical protein [Deferrisomatales bacterium]
MKLVCRVKVTVTVANPEGELKAGMPADGAIQNMPLPIQGVTHLNPLRYFLVIIHGIFLKGVGIDILWPQLVGLALLGPTTLGVAALRCRKTLS